VTTGVVRSAVILVAALAFYATDLLLVRLYDRLRAGGSSHSRDYSVALAIAAAILVAQPIVLPGLGVPTDLPGGIVLLGIGVVTLAMGLALNAWARIHLRQYYAERVEVQPKHRLVDTGPYAYVRHPLFAAYCAVAVGLLFVNPATPTLLTAAYTFIDFGKAARKEELMLSNAVAGYTEYMERTPRFLPRLSRRRGRR